jgi:hypothetical protein
MIKQGTYLASVACFALGLFLTSSAKAEFVAIFEQVGSTVDEIGDGTLNLTDLGAPGATFKFAPSVTPEFGTAFMGAPGGTGILYLNGQITGPSNFGFGNATLASGGSGDAVAGPSTGIGVALGYVSGSQLFNSSFYLNASLASLGMTPGTYTWNWGSGVNADSFTIEIAAPTQGVNNSILSDLPLPTVDVFPLTVPEPSTWAMMLVGFAGLSYAARQRKGVVRGISV